MAFHHAPTRIFRMRWELLYFETGETSARFQIKQYQPAPYIDGFSIRTINYCVLFVGDHGSLWLGCAIPLHIHGYYLFNITASSLEIDGGACCQCLADILMTCEAMTEAEDAASIFC